MVSLFFRIVLILAILLPATGPALASEADIAPEELPIGIENFPPFEYEENGVITGFDTEIVELVLKTLGYVPKIRRMPWSRVQSYARDGRLAALYSITRSPEREQYCYFSDPISTVKDVFFKRKDQKISWTSLADLKAYRIGISQGYNYAPVFMSAIQNKLFRQVHSLSGHDLELRHLIRLKLDRTDLAICEISVCRYLIQTRSPELDMIEPIDQAIGEIRPYHIGFSKKWPGAGELVQNFNAELQRLISQGRIQEIYDKYGVHHDLGN